jgi:subtilisin family serine protease
MPPVPSLPRAARPIGVFVLSVALLLGLAAASPASPVAGQTPGGESRILSLDPWIEAAPHALVVRIASGVELGGAAAVASAGGLADALRQAGVIGIRPLLPAGAPVTVAGGAPSRLARTYRLQLDPSADLAQARQTLAANAAVEQVEYDYLARGVLVPNDPEYPNQWAAPQIGLPAAWDVTTGSGEVVIALVDSGLDLTHPDLAGRLWVNPGEIPANGIDDDANGYIDDVHGWNFVSDSPNLADPYGHGTQVAGVLAATGHNGQGIAGVCWQCKIMVVTAMQAGGVANYSDIAAAVAYASSNGADIINLSLGGYADASLLAEAVREAAVTAVLVGGAGNDDSAAPFYPAAYAEVIGVAATDNGDAKAVFSNYGGWVDVAAPGDAIRTTALGGGYATAGGTSLATAYAAGVAGLIASKHPDWSADLVGWQLLNTGVAIDGQNAAYVGQLGHGRLAANRAVTVNPQPAGEVAGCSVDGQANGQPAPGATFSLVVEVRNLWLPGRSLNGTLSTSSPHVAAIPSASGSFGDIDTGQVGSNAATPFTVRLKAGAPYAAEIPFTLHLTGASGYALTLNFSVRVRSAVETLGNTNYTANTTWTSDKTYVLNGSVIVGEGATLTIHSGTQIQVAADKFIRVDGTLIARGTAEQPIVFAASNPETPWTGIRFSDSAISTTVSTEGAYVSGSVIQFVQMSHAAVALDIGSRELLIADSRFEFYEYDVAEPQPYPVGIQANPASDIRHVASRIERNRFFSSGWGAGIIMQWSRPLIRQNTFTDLSRGLEIWGSPTIENNQFNNAELAIDLGGCGNQIVRGNTVVGSYNGIAVEGISIVEGNLLDRNILVGLTVSVCSAEEVITPTVRIRNNTITNTQGQGVLIAAAALETIDLSQNNIFGSGGFDLYLADGSGSKTLDASGNFWNVPSGQVAGRIRDCTFDGNGCGTPTSTIGKVVYSPPLSAPVQDAPAFVTSLSVSPDPVGLETGTFTVDFSRPMSTSATPEIGFFDSRRGTSEVFLPGISDISALFEDAQGRIWAAARKPYPSVHIYTDGAWQSVVPSGFEWNAGLSSGMGGSNGDVWFFSNDDPKLMRLRGGNWMSWNREALFTDPSSPAANGMMGEDAQGHIWLVNSDPQVRLWTFDGQSVTQVIPPDRGNIQGTRITSQRPKLPVDSAGRVWFLISPTDSSWQGGLAVFDRETWSYHDQDTGLAHGFSELSAIFGDSQGRIWVALTSNPQQHFAGMYDGSWHFYERSADGSVVVNIVESYDGSVWAVFNDGVSMLAVRDGSWSKVQRPRSPGAGAEVDLLDSQANVWSSNGTVYWWGRDYDVVEGSWVSPTRYQAAFDFTPLVPKGTYSITVSGGIGTDGLAAADATANFDVAFGGGVTSVPPLPPQVTLASDGSLTTLALSWPSQSGVDGYRYAIGTVVGGRDVLGWTYTTAKSVTRSGLKLTSGKTYYVTVQARGTNGLWSTNNFSASFVAGSDTSAPPAPSVSVQSSSPTSVTFSWHKPRDDVDQYRYCLGTSVGACDVVAWTVTGQTATTLNGLSLVAGATYYVTVQAHSTNGLWSTNNISTSFVASTGATSPPAPSVSVQNSSLTSVTISWNNPRDDVDRYRYCIGTSAGACDIVPWTTTGQTTVTLEGLSLIAGATYYVTVQAHSTNGLWSTNNTSASFVAGQPTFDAASLFLPSLGR